MLWWRHAKNSCNLLAGGLSLTEITPFCLDCPAFPSSKHQQTKKASGAETGKRTMIYKLTSNQRIFFLFGFRRFFHTALFGIYFTSRPEYRTKTCATAFVCYPTTKRLLTIYVHLFQFQKTVFQRRNHLFSYSKPIFPEHKRSVFSLQFTVFRSAIHCISLCNPSISATLPTVFRHITCKISTSIPYLHATHFLFPQKTSTSPSYHFAMRLRVTGNKT